MLDSSSGAMALPRAARGPGGLGGSRKARSGAEPRRMHRSRILTALCCAFLAAGAGHVSAATPPKPTSAMMAPIRRIAYFVNTGAAIPAGTYAPGATITDEFAPFH